MNDLNFKVPRVIVEEVADELKFCANAIRAKRFNPRQARVMGDDRTVEDREQDHNKDRDSSADVLDRAEAILREHLKRR